MALSCKINFTQIYLIIYLFLLLEGGAGRRVAVLSILSRTHSNNSLVDSSLNAVVLLNIELGEGVVLVDRGLLKVTERGSVDDVSDGESLDGLVLGDGLGGRRASIDR